MNEGYSEVHLVAYVFMAINNWNQQLTFEGTLHISLKDSFLWTKGPMGYCCGIFSIDIEGIIAKKIRYIVTQQIFIKQ